jgi:hypothetical protein
MHSTRRIDDQEYARAESASGLAVMGGARRAGGSSGRLRGCVLWSSQRDVGREPKNRQAVKTPEPVSPVRNGCLLAKNWVTRLAGAAWSTERACPRARTVWPAKGQVAKYAEGRVPGPLPLPKTPPWRTK